MEYIIIQAGGKGTRLGSLTKNKPKALAPVDNLPMIFHLFQKYPDKRFLIIADYKREVLRRYLAAFAHVKYLIVDAQGTGTCSGIQQALEFMPEREPFLLVWSDLILPDGFALPAEYDVANDGIDIASDYIGLSGTFPCRWKYENGKLAEETSIPNGVAGFFLFREKKILSGLPENGEFVRWLQENNFRFHTLDLSGTREFGLLADYEKLTQMKTRPFNRITIDGAVLTKEPVDEQGRELARKECAWYETVRTRNIPGIPQIYATSPLRMEYIQGKSIYECELPASKKKTVLMEIVEALKTLHESASIPADSFSMREAYFTKTMQRLLKVVHLVPFAQEKYIRINGKNCRNVFFFQDQLEKKLGQLRATRFPLIHGDCTFSNLMLREDGTPVLIDPRGYFGFTELYGDARYDWAKLYYSIVGNYDQFNLKRFTLDMGGHSRIAENAVDGLDDGEVRLTIVSNGWEDLQEAFFLLTGADEYEMKLLHAVIWLSLTTYAWQDYDSICGAFYNGLYYLEDVL